MGFRFSKRIKIVKGVNLNLSKSGVGVSAGVKGLRVGTGPRGTRTTVSIPGTGISHTTHSGRKSANASSRSAKVVLVERSPSNRIVVTIVCLLFGWLGLHRLLIGRWFDGSRLLDSKSRSGTTHLV